MPPMRPGAEYPMAQGPVAPSARSPWQSPVPYLFGALAAMLGLIALSLLALACSYWNFSGPDDGQADGQAAGPGAGKGGGPAGIAGEWQRQVVVIMAGEELPTFLATPAPSTSCRAAVHGAGRELAAGVTTCSEDDAQRQTASATPLCN